MQDVGYIYVTSSSCGQLQESRAGHLPGEFAIYEFIGGLPMERGSSLSLTSVTIPSTRSDSRDRGLAFCLAIVSWLSLATSVLFLFLSISNSQNQVIYVMQYTVANNNNHCTVTWVLACGVVGNWSEERSWALKMSTTKMVPIRWRRWVLQPFQVPLFSNSTPLF